MMIGALGARSLILVGLVAIGLITLTGCPTVAQPSPGASPTSVAPAPTSTAQAPHPTTTPTRPTATPTAAPPSATPGTTPTPAGSTAVPKQAECPKLETRLYRLMVSENPAAYAAGSGLHYVNGRVRVVVEMQGPNDDLPAGYDATVETRQGPLIQALVSAADLCRLSNEPQVRFVRPPLEPVR